MSSESSEIKKQKIKLSEEELERLTELLKIIQSIEPALKMIGDLVESGALETITNLIYMIHLSKNIVNEEMVSGTANIASTMLDMSSKLIMPPMQNLINALLDHQMEFEEEISKTKVKGFWSLLSLLRDKDIQRGLSVLFAMLKVLGRNVKIKEEKK